MKKAAAYVSDKVFSYIAKKLATTGCWWGCHREEAPEELFK